MREELATLGTDAMRVLEESPRAVSVVIGPTGEPVSDVLSDREGLLYASIDTRACVEPKQFHDVVGYYNRFDVFQLTVDRTRRRPVAWWASPEAAGEGEETGGAAS
jgi:nitrilase